MYVCVTEGTKIRSFGAPWKTMDSHSVSEKYASTLFPPLKILICIIKRGYTLRPKVNMLCIGLYTLWVKTRSSATAKSTAYP